MAVIWQNTSLFSISPSILFFKIAYLFDVCVHVCVRVSVCVYGGGLDTSVRVVLMLQA